VDAFAESGLRTLVLGYKRLTEGEYRAWKVKYDEANASMVERQAKKEACYDLLENNFTLIGATAIEDRLQVRCA
jgi:phospholipid-translocating ATPase